MSNKPANPGPGRVPRRQGFTLLEVAVAVCLLALFLVPLLSAVSNAIGNIERARNIQIARELARNKLEEIRLTLVPEQEQEIGGNFAPEYPDYQYRVIFTKNPELELLEQQIGGLVTMEIQLIVSWPEAGEDKALVFQSLLAK